MTCDACAYCGAKLEASDEASLNQEFLEHGMKEHSNQLNEAIDRLNADTVEPTVIAAIVRHGEE